MFSRKGASERHSGQSTDISLGGMFIETKEAEPFGAEIVVHVHVPGEPSAFVLPGKVRWTSHEGMGIQFGLLGARETYAITELVGAHEDDTE